jgi:hypothetical protein
MRVWVGSTGNPPPPAFLTLGQQQQQTANGEVANQQGWGNEGSSVTHLAAVTDWLAVAEMTRRHR